MKTRTISVLWSVLAMFLLSGCTTVQDSPLYSMWQERAYGAYGMPVPAHSPSPFMTAAMPYRPTMANPVGYGMGVSEKEEKFISQYYSLQ